MKISELKPRQGSVELTAEVVDVGETRTFNRQGNEGRVANATVKDDSGKVVMTLWNEQIDSVKAGDTITIKNGYVGEWQGEMQLTTGKFGTLEVVPGAGQVSKAPEEKNEANEEPAPSVEEEELKD